MTAAGLSGGIAIERKCKRWSCELCQPHRRASVIRQILNGNPNRMLTLTHRQPPGASPERVARWMSETLPEFIRLCRKKVGDAELAYFCVFEAHEAGGPHLHIALRCPFIAQRWLKRVWYRLTRSYIVDIRAIGSVNRTAAYMGKYLGKDLHKFGTLKRYWQSKNYQTEDQKAFERSFPPSWQFKRDDRSLHQVEADWKREGKEPTRFAPGISTWGYWIPQLEAYAALSPHERRAARPPPRPPPRLIDQSWRGLCG